MPINMGLVGNYDSTNPNLETKDLRSTGGTIDDHDDADANLTNYAQRFGDSSTLHGMQYLIRQKVHPLRRLIWLAIVLFALVWTFHTVALGILKFQAHSVSSNINIHFEDKIRFPAVTFCNFNQFRGSLLDNETKLLITTVYQPDTGQLDSFDWDAYDNSSINLTYTTLHSELGAYKLEEMLFECTWNKDICTAQNFSRFLTDFGVCQTFNDPGDEKNGFVVNKPGKDSGLTMVLNIGHMDYIPFEFQSAGMKVYLHQQGEFPIMKEHGFAVSPGFETLISIKSTEFESLPYPFPSKCTNQKLQYSNSYTIPLCIHECKVNYIAKLCGCRDYRFPEGTSEKLCSPKELVKCSIPNEQKFSTLNVSCTCPTPCYTHIYEGRISMSYWPSRPVAEKLLDTYPQFIDNADLRENLMRIKIYYEELSYTSVREVEYYDVSSLESDIGGTMGLFCGMSLITVVEFADFFCVLFLRKFTNFRD